MLKFDPYESSILYYYIGSKSHGMHTEESDLDFQGVCVPPPNYYFGLDKFDTFEDKSDPEKDIKIYSVHHMFKMLLGCNPNVFPYLYQKPEMYITFDTAGEWLLDNRDIFISKSFCAAFLGYATGEFKRVNKVNGRMGEKRKSFHDRYGYDTRSANNCIRLLRMGVHFMKTGEMLVDRTDIDAKELLDIKHGKYSYQEIKTIVNKLFEEGKEAEKNCKFPDTPDFDVANDLIQAIIKHKLKL